MSDKPSTSAAETAAGATSTANVSNATGTLSSAAPPKRPVVDNPAFRAMGLPRLRLPSRNWLIFLSITGSFAGAVLYDKWQTRRVKQKWADVVSHIADERLSTKNMPRKLTVYLSAPPGDGLRSAREHFHEYVKPVLVAAAMDWDVVEGRKEGDVRHKTAERIRRKRKRAGEGEPMPEEEAAKQYAVEMMREHNGTSEYDGLAGDLVIGRNTWKEYVRGLHEGWLGPADAPQQPVPEPSSNLEQSKHVAGQPSLGDSVEGAANVVAADTPDASPAADDSASSSNQEDTTQADEKPQEEKKEEEKPKARNPPASITPSEYHSASLSSHTPEMVGPSTPIPFPHILGFLNTPVRTYRFLTRRRQADDIGRQVAAAVMASTYRPYETVTVSDEDSASGSGTNVPEQTQILVHEEANWQKAVRAPRKEHEESVWIEDVVLDERLASRMRKFELTSEDEARAKRVGDGTEKVTKPGENS
ncbi:hypothetical protein LTR36_005290 [Oleoguttula mirabilis]|uniref:Mitochondrial import inner membrane translocase subunit TIM54 n=1 Tax=Oleoguttula mirabilis TaxID=1507867 RepID=A0AAV9JEM5_9PEZI|nr:hypothetical protein LTR36_005290 [Oleoguttula mirabilis]